MMDYGRRGGIARAHRHVIDGKSYTTAEVAAKLGLTISGARKRLQKREHTWAAMRK
jgi:hypothetical protein